MRKIFVNETNTNLKYVYFQIYLLDGETPALGLVGLAPEVSINGEDYETDDIGVLQEMGIGSYRALLSDSSLSTVGNIILSHFFKIGVLDSYGEPIEVIENSNQFIEDDIPSFVSYVSMSEAENYFALRLNSGEWDNAVLTDKMKSLSMATGDIDNLQFKGIKTDPNQILEFPRTISGDIIPGNIKKATCEIAIRYLEGVNMEDEINNINISSEGFGGVQESYSAITAIEHFRAGINSSLAWRYLLPFLQDPRTLRIVRA